MNPTESYCDHLRGQLKDWQRAFRIKKGRLPSREDFEALKDDGSSRARIVYDAYTALNQATGNSFSKTLMARDSASSMLVIGGPRGGAIERGSAGAGLATNRKLAGSTADKDSRNGRVPSGKGPPGSSFSQHLAVMDRLRPKVQPRSSFGAPAGNAVLAAGDGHRRAEGQSATANPKRADDCLSTAKVSVSRRAKAMGAKAELSYPAAPVMRRSPKPTERREEGPVVHRGGYRGSEGPRGHPARRSSGLSRDSRIASGDKSDPIIAPDAAGGLEGGNAGGVAEPRAQVRPGSLSVVDESNSPERCRAPTRRHETLNKAERRKLSVGGNGLLHLHSKGDRRSGSREGGAASSVLAEIPQARKLPPGSFLTAAVDVLGQGPATSRAGVAKTPCTLAREPSDVSSYPARSLGSRTASQIDDRGVVHEIQGAGFMPDEVGLAAAMAGIMESASLAPSSGDGAPACPVNAPAMTENVAGSRLNSRGRSSGGTDAGESSSTFIPKIVGAPRGDTSKAAKEARAGGIRGPGLVAPGKASRTSPLDPGEGDDWRLRASRAVGRALEDKQEAVSSLSGSGEHSSGLGYGEKQAGGDTTGAWDTTKMGLKSCRLGASGGDAEESSCVRSASPGPPVSEGSASANSPKRSPTSPGADTPGGDSVLDTPTGPMASLAPGAQHPAGLSEIRGVGASPVDTSPDEKSTATRNAQMRISDSEGEDGAGGGGLASSDGGDEESVTNEHVKRREKDAAGGSVRPERGKGAPAKGDGPASASASGGGSERARARKKAAVGKGEVSDNFVRMDLKSRGSSRFKRKGSLRSKARGGAAGGSRGRYGRGGYGSKWGRRNGARGSDRGGWAGAEDPVTGERREVPRDRPLSSGGAKNRAGLDVLDQCLDALATATGGTQSAQFLERPRNAKEEEELFLRLAPKCTRHQRAGRLLTVKKSGINKGRRFYACSLPRGEGCDFFMWAEDNPALVLSELKRRETGDEWVGRKAEQWTARFQKLPASELKKELRKRSLGCVGRKDDLVRRLVHHATAKLETTWAFRVEATVPVPAVSPAKPPVEGRRPGNSGDGDDRGCSVGVGSLCDGDREPSSGRGARRRRGKDRGVGDESSEDEDGDSDGDGDSDRADSESDEGDDSDDFEFTFGDGAMPSLRVISSGAIASTNASSTQASIGEDCPAPSTVASVDDYQNEQGSEAGEIRDGKGADGNGARRGDGGEGKEILESIGYEDTGKGGNMVWASLVESDGEDSEEEDDWDSESDVGDWGVAGDGNGDPVACDLGRKKRREHHDPVTNSRDSAQAPKRRRTLSPRRTCAARRRRSSRDGPGGVEESDDPTQGGIGNTALERGAPDGMERGRVGTKRRLSGHGTEVVEIEPDVDEEDGEGEGMGSIGADEMEDDDDGDGEEVVDGKPLTPESALRTVFGHKSFRDGQEWGIERALAGLPTLLVLATGSGKSLAYQLPALLLPGITVVVSPLVSLMEDQMANLPPQLPGASLSGSHGGLREVARTVRDLQAGRVKVLFLSPEKLCSPSFRRLASTPNALPTVSLLCVDEAHCVSQWSHNFRPSYLRLGQALELLRPRGVMALTATASRAVIRDICTTLRIPSEGVRVGSWDRPNLEVRVLRAVSDEDKRETLSRLLSEAPLNRGSVVVYVWRQATAEALSTLLQGDGHRAVAYHGGMEIGARQNAQNAFTRGRSRIVVATVAFGLGVDMRDIRGVIHFDMPKSIENYVQEIGRAGRDGRTAHCCLLLCDRDFVTHHSLAHSKGLELVQVRGLLRAIVGDVRPGSLMDPSGCAGSREQVDGARGRGEQEEGKTNQCKPGEIVDGELRCLEPVGSVGGSSAAGSNTKPLSGDTKASSGDLKPSDDDPKLSNSDLKRSNRGVKLSNDDTKPSYSDATPSRVDCRSLVPEEGDRDAGVQKALSVVDLEAKLDIGGEVVETVLSMLEGEPYRLLKLHATMDDSLRVHFRKRRPSALAADGEPVIGLLLALGIMEGMPAGPSGYSYGHGSAKISLVQLSEALGWATTAVVRELRRLQLQGEIDYSLSQRSYHITVLKGLSGKALEGVSADLHRTLARAEALEADKVEAVYRALVAEVAGGSEGNGDATAASLKLSSAASGSVKPAGLLQMTISRYFDQGGGAESPAEQDAAPVSMNDAGVADERATRRESDPKVLGILASPREERLGVDDVPAGVSALGGPGGDASSKSTSSGVTSSRGGPSGRLLPPLPHKTFDQRACELLVRDASVLVSNPSFQGRLDAGSNGVELTGAEGGGPGSWEASGVAALGDLRAAGRFGITSMAPHAWLLKDVPMLARAVARVFHGIGSVSFPATTWRGNTFWARYRDYAFYEVLQVKEKLELAFRARGS